tara:strand:- start:76 stop:939 length:864 start_codon:yes stop_codon:yes gene_type:complete
MKKYKHLDLFSGIGGFSLGLEATGAFETVAFCDYDQYCQKVLRKHWPWVTIYDDVKELNSERLSANGHTEVDIITGGYPCQPFSIAGRQKGEQDPRHVWPEMFRLVKELRPTWVIGENVSGHIKLGLDTVLENLESEGYATRRLVFQLRASVQTTKEKGSGYWRTPDAHSMRGPCSETRMKMKLEKNLPISLNDQVRHPNLMWPTPRAKEPGRTTVGYGRGLKELVEGKQQRFPTPTARDWRDAGPNVNYEKVKKKGRLAGHSGGSLNPTWVEWLMGYPKGWTDLNH